MKKFFLLFSLTFCSVVCAKTFVVGVQDIAFYPLYDFPNSSHSKELLDAFAKSRGYEFIYLPLPVKRTNYWYEEHAIDFKYPDSVRWIGDRSVYKQLKFSVPAVKLVAGTVVKAENRGKQRLEIKTLGTVLGFHATMWLDLIDSGNTKLVESTSPLNIVKQVLYGHIDATNIEPSVVNYYLALMGKENGLIIDKALPYEIYSYQLSTIEYEDVLLEFNQFIKSNQEFLELLRKKYNLTDIREY
ncbi:hypothetical protein [Thalassotalea profundi]|uniref:Solute-binding protein family 3/N-terminal domain-containing protein n=1 Tax=Thalassotalea profundi TaxID=2036687 RepID=A0ABQ3IN77_9GAMM|nr:hypothetical protein [Thalassotalea profundi]GHE86378.1 hypothetical protein GCM10011501_14420 [Thalassotalea profundi]